MIALEAPVWEFLFRFPSAKSEQVILPGVIRKRVQHNKQSRAYKQSRSPFFIEMVGQKEVPLNKLVERIVNMRRLHYPRG